MAHAIANEIVRAFVVLVDDRGEPRFVAVSGGRAHLLSQQELHI